MLTMAFWERQHHEACFSDADDADNADDEKVSAILLDAVLCEGWLLDIVGHSNEVTNPVHKLELKITNDASGGR